MEGLEETGHHILLHSLNLLLHGLLGVDNLVVLQFGVEEVGEDADEVGGAVRGDLRGEEEVLSASIGIEGGTIGFHLMDQPVSWQVPVAVEGGVFEEVGGTSSVAGLMATAHPYKETQGDSNIWGGEGGHSETIGEGGDLGRALSPGSCGGRDVSVLRKDSRWLVVSPWSELFSLNK